MTSLVPLGMSLPFWGLLLSSITDVGASALLQGPTLISDRLCPHSPQPLTPGILFVSKGYQVLFPLFWLILKNPQTFTENYLFRMLLSEECWKTNHPSGPKGVDVKGWHFKAWSSGSGTIGASCMGTEPGACSLLALNQMKCG